MTTEPGLHPMRCATLNRVANMTFELSCKFSTLNVERHDEDDDNIAIDGELSTLALLASLVHGKVLDNIGPEQVFEVTVPSDIKELLALAVA